MNLFFFVLGFFVGMAVMIVLVLMLSHPTKQKGRLLC